MLTAPPPPMPVVVVFSLGGGVAGNNVSTRGSRIGLTSTPGKAAFGPFPRPEWTCLNELTQTSGRSTLISRTSLPGAEPVVVRAVQRTWLPEGKRPAET